MDLLSTFATVRIKKRPAIHNGAGLFNGLF